MIEIYIYSERVNLNFSAKNCLIFYLELIEKAILVKKIEIEKMQF